MNYRMTGIAFLVIIVSLVALLVVGTEGSGHMVFANRDSSGHETFTNKGINVQTETNQDQGYESAGGTSGLTNACTATSGRGSTETSTGTTVTLRFEACRINNVQPLFCFNPFPPENCNNIGCGPGSILNPAITCTGNFANPGDCTTDNGVHLTSCTFNANTFIFTSCTLTPETHTVPGTGITQSGGVSG